MLIDILFYLGMGALVFIGVGTVLAIAHVDLPTWVRSGISGGWVFMLVVWLAWMILPGLIHILSPRR